MPRFIPCELWQPLGVKSLEPNALDVVRDDANGLVVAGPGAGKTELLAQRACYLLQTGACRPPLQILALCFKKDAAANLQRRVEKRCGEKLGRRFHSLTFDPFSKSLVDRFGRALPDEYRPSSDYTINFDIQKRTRHLLDSLVGGATGLTMREVSGITPDRLYRRAFLGRALPIPSAEPISLENRVAIAFWRSLLSGSSTSQLDFGMIGRLAGFILRLNPLILAAVRQTYSHVFLDEFQDTTEIQYALTLTLFRGSDTVLTAVGDPKQRIMAWAGAVETIFGIYRDDFGAAARDLLMNYRSAPNLVRIQHALITAIEPGAPPPQSADHGTDGEGECRVFLYTDHAREAVHLAEIAAGWVQKDGLKPRDICVLTRQKPAEYVEFLIRELNARSIKARVETDIQSLIVEPLAMTMFAAMKLAALGRHRDSWTSLVDLLREIRGLNDDDPKVRMAERELSAACQCLGVTLKEPESDLKASPFNMDTQPTP